MRRGDPLISEIARTFEPGCKFDYMPVFIGNQGIGKSTFVRKLSLDPLFYTDSVVGIGTKQAAELVQGKWFVELPELAAMKGAALEAVKAFITRQADEYRMPYARSAKTLIRSSSSIRVRRESWITGSESRVSCSTRQRTRSTLLR